MKAIIKEAGKAARIEDIPNTLEALQSLVGGYIETCTIFEGSTFVVNEEGRLLGLKPNALLDFVGTVLVLGIGEEDFTDLTDQQARGLLSFCNFGKAASGDD
jgi:hypothetical protein